VALTAIPVMVGGYLLFSALLTDRLFPGG